MNNLYSDLDPTRIRLGNVCRNEMQKENKLRITLLFLNITGCFSCFWGMICIIDGELVRAEKRAIFNAGSGQVTFSHSSVVTMRVFYCGLLHSCRSGLGWTGLASLVHSEQSTSCEGWGVWSKFLSPFFKGKHFPMFAVTVLYQSKKEYSTQKMILPFSLYW